MWARREDSTEKKGRPVLLGNKDGWMIGSNPSLRSFHIASCSVPWHFLLTSLLFIYLFLKHTKWKKNAKKKYEMVGVRKKCQGIFSFPFFRVSFDSTPKEICRSAYILGLITQINSLKSVRIKNSAFLPFPPANNSHFEDPFFFLPFHQELDFTGLEGTQK